MQRDDSVNELDRPAPIHCRHTEAGLTADTLGLGGPARRASKTERLAVAASSSTRSWKKAGGRGRRDERDASFDVRGSTMVEAGGVGGVEPGGGGGEARTRVCAA